jgi:transposase
MGRTDLRGSCHCLLAGQQPWAWLTSRGGRLTTGVYGEQRPRLIGLTHIRAINEVRLYLEDVAPSGHWVSERELRRCLSHEDAIPDGLFEIAGERHAIEVELSRKVRSALEVSIGLRSSRYDAVIVEVDGERHAIEIELRKRTEEDALSVLAHRSLHYDAVVCFCTPESHRFYERLLAKNQLPKVRIQHLPAADSLPSLPPSRWAASLDFERCQVEASSPIKAPPQFRRKNTWQPDENPERSEVSDELWATIKKLLPGDQRPRGIGSYARRAPDRAALSGVIYIARQGGNRKSLPTDLGYGEGGSCIRRLRSWEADGAWPAVRSLLEDELPDGDTIAWNAVAPWR